MSESVQGQECTNAACHRLSLDVSSEDEVCGEGNGLQTQEHGRGGRASHIEAVTVQRPQGHGAGIEPGSHHLWQCRSLPHSLLCLVTGQNVV